MLGMAWQRFATAVPTLTEVASDRGGGGEFSYLGTHTGICVFYWADLFVRNGAIV